ncbi:glycosyltransferase family 39 protein [Pararhizobium sp. YC-54]|uniref:ArnT family glycosyltransferase n=1 Tax=Pararhizobium sp. YC-54 TaxID=2986920 RepID=UPI0021F7554F|nr:glycosyltransferase family 39 protein [Pararhizobium sp. YC-54]MCV9997704.1 glycosyltransferase family 39 protein [Pararhizobium sp. YC-54]
MLRTDFRRPDAMIFAVAAYFVLCVALRVFISPALEIDEGEQAFVSQFLALGYGPQPPFYNWLQYAVVEAFGVSLTALTALKHLMLFLCCLFYGLAAQIVIRDRALAAIAMLGVLTLPPVFLLAQRDLSHTVSALFAVSLFLYGFFRTLRNPSLFSYLLTGIAVGIGLISKYNFALVPAAAVLAVLPERDLRQRIFDWRVIASLSVAFAIVLPHAYWVVNNLTSASAGTINEMKEGLSGGRLTQAVKGIVSLISAIFGASILPLVFFAAVFPFDIKRAYRAESQWTRITGRMICLCLVAVLMIVLGLGATHIREKWLAVFVVLLPLYLCLKIDAAGIETSGKLKRFAIPLFIMIFAVLIGVSARVLTSPMLGSYNKLNTPYDAFIREITQNHAIQPALVIADDTNLAGSVRLQLPQSTVITSYKPQGPLAAEWRSAGPVLVIWRGNGEPQPALPDNLRRKLVEGGVASSDIAPIYSAPPYHLGKGNDRYGFGYLWLTEKKP